MGFPSGRVKSQAVQFSVSRTVTEHQVRADRARARYPPSGDQRAAWLTIPSVSHITAAVRRSTTWTLSGTRTPLT